MRTILDTEILELKGATEASFTRGGGVTSFASLTRCNVSTLSKYSSVTVIVEPDGNDRLEYGDRMIPIDIAVEADRRAKHPWIIGEAARQLGYRLVPEDRGERSTEPLRERDAHTVLAEAMDVSRGLLDGLADGRLDALERKNLGKDLRELIDAATGVLDRLGRIDRMGER